MNITVKVISSYPISFQGFPTVSSIKPKYFSQPSTPSTLGPAYLLVNIGHWVPSSALGSGSLAENKADKFSALVLLALHWRRGNR